MTNRELCVVIFPTDKNENVAIYHQHSSWTINDNVQKKHSKYSANWQHSKTLRTFFAFLSATTQKFEI